MPDNERVTRTLKQIRKELNAQTPSVMQLPDVKIPPKYTKILRISDIIEKNLPSLFEANSDVVSGFHLRLLVGDYLYMCPGSGPHKFAGAIAIRLKSREHRTSASLRAVQRALAGEAYEDCFIFERTEEANHFRRARARAFLSDQREFYKSVKCYGVGPLRSLRNGRILGTAAIQSSSEAFFTNERRELYCNFVRELARDIEGIIELLSEDVLTLILFESCSHLHVLGQLRDRQEQIRAVSNATFQLLHKSNAQELLDEIVETASSLFDVECIQILFTGDRDYRLAAEFREPDCTPAISDDECKRFCRRLEQSTAQKVTQPELIESNGRSILIHHLSHQSYMQKSSLGFLVLQASDPFFLTGKEDIVKDFADHIAVALWNQGLRDELSIQSEDLIKEKLSQRDRYAAICHELNKRLAYIVGCHETLKKRLPGDEDLENAGQVVKEMNQQIKKIFNLTGDLRAETSIPVNFDKLLDDVIREMELLQRYQNRDITIICKGTKVGNIMADRELLYEALSNLASNAVKFNKPGGAITFSVNVVPGETCSSVECSVADTGKGLTDTEIETLFRIPRKYKASNRDQGIGIGLYIARQAARELGGDITLVETEIGKGTIFRFSFPIRPANSI